MLTLTLGAAVLIDQDPSDFSGKNLTDIKAFVESKTEQNLNCKISKDNDIHTQRYLYVNLVRQGKAPCTLK